MSILDKVLNSGGQEPKPEPVYGVFTEPIEIKKRGVPDFIFRSYDEEKDIGVYDAGTYYFYSKEADSWLGLGVRDNRVRYSKLLKTQYDLMRKVTQENLFRPIKPRMDVGKLVLADWCLKGQQPIPIAGFLDHIDGVNNKASIVGWSLSNKSKMLKFGSKSRWNVKIMDLRSVPWGY